MKLIFTILGLVLILFGLLTLFLPLPTGVFSLLAGIALLASVSEAFRKFFRWLRRKIRPLDAAMDKASDLLPEPVSKPLRRTEPCDDEDEDEDAKDGDGTPNDNCRGKKSAAGAIVRLPARYLKDQRPYPVPRS
ncbi:MAG: PGPGW domain-containing protein, partial [Parvularcula sp.]